jgi:hypothetical protein
VVVGVKAGKVEVEAGDKTLVEVSAELGRLIGYAHFTIGLTGMGGLTVPSAKKHGNSQKKRKGCSKSSKRPNGTRKC